MARGTGVLDAEFAVRAENVWKSYGDNQVLRGVDLSVARGEVVAIAGPSGSGKSTFLRCINALETIDQGAVFIEDKLIGYEERNGALVRARESRIAKDRARVSMVFQHYNLFPHMTALANVMEGPVRALGRKPEEAKAEALALLDRVGLGKFAQHYPQQLSGGQQQRVGIARALAMKPAAVLFDEPTSALDPELVGEVLAVMREVAESGMTMIVVTHEISFARNAASRMIFMDGGKVVEEGPPSDVIDNPKSERARDFFGSVRVDH
jgi:polar amino acid transport system ATP-binding protein